MRTLWILALVGLLGFVPAAGCTYVSVPGKFTLLDTKDNSGKIAKLTRDPNTGELTLEGFELVNNASGPINAYSALVTGLVEQLRALMVLQVQRNPAAAGGLDEAACAALADRLMARIETRLWGGSAESRKGGGP